MRRENTGWYGNREYSLDNMGAIASMRRSSRFVGTGAALAFVVAPAVLPGQPSASVQPTTSIVLTHLHADHTLGLAGTSFART